MTPGPGPGPGPEPSQVPVPAAAQRPGLPVLPIALHVVAVVLAAVSGHLARWAFHEGTQAGAPGMLDVLVGAAVLGGLLSVVCQVGALLVPAAALRRERLAWQALGTVLSGAPLLCILVVGALTLGSLLPQIGNLMSVLCFLALLACAGIGIHLDRTRHQARWTVLLLAAGSALCVAFFAPWWLLNGAFLVSNLLE